MVLLMPGSLRAVAVSNALRVLAESIPEMPKKKKQKKR